MDNSYKVPFGNGFVYIRVNNKVNKGLSECIKMNGNITVRFNNYQKAWYEKTTTITLFDAKIEVPLTLVNYL